MKKMLVVLALTAFIAGTSGFAFCASEDSGSEAAKKQNGWGPGPAENAGDGVPDGPGWPDWPESNDLEDLGL